MVDTVAMAKNKKLVMLDIDDVYNKNDVFTDIGWNCTESETAG